MKVLPKILLAGCFVLAFMQALHAQPLPPSSTPIDGGLISILLLGGGGALAAKKIRERQKRKNNPDSEL